ncbi:hypothetical protein KM043_006854 [Ampulex compressa]|nr:hypothetical protein KM043_006854 [Ampulex compressa]
MQRKLKLSMITSFSCSNLILGEKGPIAVPVFHKSPPREAILSGPCNALASYRSCSAFHPDFACVKINKECRLLGSQKLAATSSEADSCLSVFSSDIRALFLFWQAAHLVGPFAGDKNKAYRRRMPRQIIWNKPRSGMLLRGSTAASLVSRRRKAKTSGVMPGKVLCNKETTVYIRDAQLGPRGYLGMDRIFKSR